MPVTRVFGATTHWRPTGRADLHQQPPPDMTFSKTTRSLSCHVAFLFMQKGRPVQRIQRDSINVGVGKRMISDDGMERPTKI
jgi:hypothetical protein